MGDKRKTSGRQVGGKWKTTGKRQVGEDKLETSLDKCEASLDKWETKDKWKTSGRQG